MVFSQTDCSSPRKTTVGSSSSVAGPLTWRALKTANKRKLELDSLPPVQFHHLLVDMGSFAIFVTTLLVPFTCYKFIAHLETNFYLMFSIMSGYIVLQYWLVAGYFMLVEALGMCDDMFVVDPQKRISFWHGAPKVLRNQLFGCLWSLAALYFIQGFIGGKPTSEFYGEFPSTWTILKTELLGALVFSEFWMYCTHRALHHPLLFAYHKEHHEQNHVHLTVAWGARYCPLVEDLLCNVSAIVIYTFYFCPHPAFTMHWVAHTQWNVIANHTGYHEKFLPFTAMMAGMVHHNHHSNGQYDFGTTAGWMDWLFNTKGPNHPGSIMVTTLDAIWVACGGKSKL